MKRTCVVLGLLCGVVVGVFGTSGVARAEMVYSSEQSFTLTATVLEHRTIVVDANGVISEISSNTENNITPEVRFLTNDGPKSVLTLGISEQYQHLMSQLNDNHIFVMDRQSPTINGLVPQLLLPISQRAYVVKPTVRNNEPDTQYMIYQ